MKEKIDKESLGMVTDLIGEAYDMAKGFLREQEDLMRDPFKQQRESKEEGLAFIIFDIIDQKKVNVRKIYLNGHIEGFEGNPVIVNHIFPKIQAIKYFAQSMNKEYRDLMLKCLAMDFYPVRTLDNLYQKNKETIEKI